MPQLPNPISFILTGEHNQFPSEKDKANGTYIFVGSHTHFILSLTKMPELFSGYILMEWNDGLGKPAGKELEREDLGVITKLPSGCITPVFKVAKAPSINYELKLELL